jgi:TolA-binding protein
MTATPKVARSGEPRAGQAASDSTETNGVQRGRRAASVASTPTRQADQARRADQAGAVRRSAVEDSGTELVRASSLGEETRLMEQAMVALGEGDQQQARRSLEEHARRFPGGLLQRERERGLARLRHVEAEPPATDSSR